MSRFLLLSIQTDLLQALKDMQTMTNILLQNRNDILLPALIS